MSAPKDVAAGEQTATPVFVEQAAAAPPPPPPPAASPASQSAQPELPTPVQIEPQNVPDFVQPTEVPETIPEPTENVVVPTQSSVATESLPTGASVTATPLAPGVASGVPGGVEGGVSGGVVGGEVGGVVGGVPGGVVGGQVGGVPGGEVGGIPGGSPDGDTNSTVPTGPVRVGGNVKAPRVIHRTDPEYTEVARKGRVRGVVVVEAIIDRHGNVDRVKVIKGLPLGLSEAAADAVKKWKFKPGTMGGQPVDVIFNLTVTFTLDGSARADSSSSESDSE
jgi:protein TonB